MSGYNLNDPRSYEINEGEGLFPALDRIITLSIQHPVKFVANTKLMGIGLFIMIEMMISWMFTDEAAFPSWIFNFVMSFFGYGVFLWICRIFYVIGLIVFYHMIFIILLIPICKIFGVGKIWYVPMPQLDETYRPGSEARQSKPETQTTAQQESLERNEENQARFCRYCGNPVSPDMKFCSRCGKQL